MSILQLSPLDNLYLYNSNISIELGYLLVDESLVNAHPNNLNMLFSFLKILCLNHNFTLFNFHITRSTPFNKKNRFLEI